MEKSKAIRHSPPRHRFGMGGFPSTPKSPSRTIAIRTPQTHTPLSYLYRTRKDRAGVHGIVAIERIDWGDFEDK